MAQATNAETAAQPIYDVIVLGAGVSGIYQIKRLTDLGLNAVVLEADDDLGGTWYRNRYPGARFDSESYTYGYSFSKELLDEWHWKEHYSGQPENLRYLNFVADKFDLRRHMHFNTRVQAMRWNEQDHTWHLTTNQSTEWIARFVVCGVGPLSMPTLPRLPGLDDFQGPSFHTYHWPKEPIDFWGLQGRRHRHRCDGHSGHRRDSRQSRRPDRIPTTSELERAPQQLTNL